MYAFIGNRAVCAARLTKYALCVQGAAVFLHGLNRTGLMSLTVALQNIGAIHTY